MRQRLSPNFNARPSPIVDTLVLHYTGMKTAEAAIDLLCDPVAEVSSHYVVEEDGTIWQLVPEELRAWHAGVSFWRGRQNLNNNSIGIEVVNPGHEWGYRDFPALQMAAVADLCLGIFSRHPITPRNVVAHSDIAPNRKQDPGEKFDWFGLAQNGIGIWAPAPDLGVTHIIRDAAGLAPIRLALSRIGYDVVPEGAIDPALSTVLRAFQRHWRPETVNGQADRGTVERIYALLARLS